MLPIDRKPAVAGQFYPADSLALTRQLEELFSQAEPRQHVKPAALIVPHAGYVFSGKVAASAYNQISPDASFETCLSSVQATAHHSTGPAFTPRRLFDTPGPGQSEYNTGQGADRAPCLLHLLSGSRPLRAHILKYKFPFCKNTSSPATRLSPSSSEPKKLRPFAKSPMHLNRYSHLKISCDFD